jgi:hypothetical protein
VHTCTAAHRRLLLLFTCIISVSSFAIVVDWFWCPWLDLVDSFVTLLSPRVFAGSFLRCPYLQTLVICSLLVLYCWCRWWLFLHMVFVICWFRCVVDVSFCTPFVLLIRLRCHITVCCCSPLVVVSLHTVFVVTQLGAIVVPHTDRVVTTHLTFFVPPHNYTHSRSRVSCTHIFVFVLIYIVMILFVGCCCSFNLLLYLCYFFHTVHCVVHTRYTLLFVNLCQPHLCCILLLCYFVVVTLVVPLLLFVWWRCCCFHTIVVTQHHNCWWCCCWC